MFDIKCIKLKTVNSVLSQRWACFCRSMTQCTDCRIFFCIVSIIFEVGKLVSKSDKINHRSNTIYKLNNAVYCHVSARKLIQSKRICEHNRYRSLMVMVMIRPFELSFCQTNTNLRNSFLQLILNTQSNQ